MLAMGRNVILLVVDYHGDASLQTDAPFQGTKTTASTHSNSAQIFLARPQVNRKVQHHVGNFGTRPPD
jgi:hypothetical protein